MKRIHFLTRATLLAPLLLLLFSRLTLADVEVSKPADLNKDQDKLLEILADPNSMAFNRLKQLVHTTNNQQLGEVQRGVGWREWSFANSIAALDVRTVKDVLDVLEAGVLAKMGTRVTEQHKIEVRTILDKALGRAQFSLCHVTFKAPSGNGIAMGFKFYPVKTEFCGPTKCIRMFYYTSTLDFVPANDYRIESWSSSGFFSSSSGQRVIELPVTLQEDHLKQVMDSLNGRHMMQFLLAASENEKRLLGDSDL